MLVLYLPRALPSIVLLIAVHTLLHVQRVLHASVAAMSV